MLNKRERKTITNIKCIQNTAHGKLLAPCDKYLKAKEWKKNEAKQKTKAMPMVDCVARMHNGRFCKMKERKTDGKKYTKETFVCLFSNESDLNKQKWNSYLQQNLV